MDRLEEMIDMLVLEESFHDFLKGDLSYLIDYLNTGEIEEGSQHKLARIYSEFENLHIVNNYPKSYLAELLSLNIQSKVGKQVWNAVEGLEKIEKFIEDKRVLPQY